MRKDLSTWLVPSLTSVVSSAPPAARRPLRRAFGLALALPLLWAASACSLFGGGNAGPPRQKGEPSWSGCVTGSSLEKAQNCAEYCATQNLACQNNGCGHLQNMSTRFGGATYTNSICSGNPVRSYQCNDPFLQDEAVRCCCVGL
jgi:hypothetical protein